MEAKRIQDAGSRNASQLTNDLVRVVIDDKGGMVPELSLWRENGYLNTHWIPYFRSNSGESYNERRHKAYWAGSLLYEIAGNFPCLPSFGLPSEVYGTHVEQHGTTANATWKLETQGVLEGRGAYSVAALPGVVKGLSYRKYDILLAGHPVHYSVIRVANRSSSAYRINAGWHNTVSSPFLEKGCLIDLSATHFATPPSPSEFDGTGRIAQGAQFDDLARAPLRNGTTLDARIVPGMVGFTDFVVGAVPADVPVGWSSVVNANLGAVYLSFFKSEKNAGERDIVLTFNDVWMQYGGRRFTPWALTEGGTDQTFCLGVENTLAAYANGLEYSLAHPSLLDRPTLVEVPAGAERMLYYGTLAARYEGGSLDSGVSRVEPERGMLRLVANDGGTSQVYSADAEFSAVEEMVRELA